MSAKVNLRDVCLLFLACFALVDLADSNSLFAPQKGSVSDQSIDANMNTTYLRLDGTNSVLASGTWNLMNVDEIDTQYVRSHLFRGYPYVTLVEYQGWATKPTGLFFMFDSAGTISMRHVELDELYAWATDVLSETGGWHYVDEGGDAVRVLSSHLD